MKAYRFISVSLVHVDTHGNSKVDPDYSIDIKEGTVTRFSLKGCAYSGLEQVFAVIVERLLRVL